MLKEKLVESSAQKNLEVSFFFIFFLLFFSFYTFFVPNKWHEAVEQDGGVEEGEGGGRKRNGVVVRGERGEGWRVVEGGVILRSDDKTRWLVTSATCPT